MTMRTSQPLIGLSEPPPYGVYNPSGTSDVVLICEHASPLIPEALNGLGLPDSDQKRHIGWDIGALRVAEQLADLLDAPLFYTNYSRLVLDANRPHASEQMFPEISERTVIPGNLNLSEAEKAQRVAYFFEPFHTAIDRFLDRRLEQLQSTRIVTVHSFTPVYKDETRPWEVGILYGTAKGFGQQIIGCLQCENITCIGENEPYQIDINDYAIPVHGDKRGIPAVLIELRHDLISTPPGIQRWTKYLARALEEKYETETQVTTNERSY